MLVRRLEPGDSLEDLTALLHRAYASLAQMGLRFVATYQDVQTTSDRVAAGECFVAVECQDLVGTITLYQRGEGCATYDREDVAHFGQFGIEPSAQGKGVGRALLTKVEERARELGKTEIALDTSEQATHLIALYRRWGYAVVETIQWPVTNYRSVVMTKRLE